MEYLLKQVIKGINWYFFFIIVVPLIILAFYFIIIILKLQKENKKTLNDIKESFKSQSEKAKDNNKVYDVKLEVNLPPGIIEVLKDLIHQRSISEKDELKERMIKYKNNKEIRETYEEAVNSVDPTKLYNAILKNYLEKKSIESKELINRFKKQFKPYPVKISGPYQISFSEKGIDHLIYVDNKYLFYPQFDHPKLSNYIDFFEIRELSNEDTILEIITPPKFRQISNDLWEIEEKGKARIKGD